MKLTDSALYLSLIREALGNTVLPEVQSTAAKTTIGWIRLILDELERREGALPRTLIASNHEGDAIAATMRDALNVARQPGTGTQPDASATDFKRAADTYAALSREITSLARALHERQPDAPILQRAAAWEANSHVKFIQAPLSESLPRSVSEEKPTAAFERFLRSVHPARERLVLDSLELMTGGLGNQTYLARVRDGASTQTYVIRKQDKHPTCGHPSFDRQREFELLQVLHQLGFSVPKPFWFGNHVAGIDAPFSVLEKARGTPVGAVLNESADTAQESQILHMADLLAQLHSIPLERFEGFIRRFDSPSLVTDSAHRYAQRVNASWREYAASRDLLPSPLFDYLLNWLDANVPHDERRPVLAHGDFGPHNLLGENGRVTAVLDWEGSMFGAPELDLAFVRTRISHIVSWDTFVDRYVSQGGSPPREESMAYYDAFYNMRVLLVLNESIQQLQKGATRNLRFATFETGFIPRFMGQPLPGLRS